MFKVKENPVTSESCRDALIAIQDALYVLNGKWKLPIIVALSEGKKRFGEIQKAVKGIAPKVLSSELKALELNGFVIRHVHNEFPVLVEYELTEYSNTLENVIKSLSEWGKQHREKIKAELTNGNGNSSSVAV
jgi:DNA-binding HxlR family transcriptional regulator